MKKTLFRSVMIVLVGIIMIISLVVLLNLGFIAIYEFGGLLAGSMFFLGWFGHVYFES